jgi:hypothetical protein
VLRFVNCRGKVLQYQEILLAEKCIMRYVQRESFAGMQDERLACMDPVLDEEGIIRLRTRIVERADVGDSAIPVVLPSRHSIVERLVLSTREVMPCWGTRAIESLTREVLDFESSKKRQNHSVKMCQVQKT